MWIKDSNISLSKPVNCPDNVNMVSDLITTIGVSVKINNWFSTEECNAIYDTAIHHNEDDSIIWSLTFRGQFTAKYLYQVKMDNMYKNEHNYSGRMQIWKLDTSFAIKLFIWKRVQGILPTNVRFAKKNVLILFAKSTSLEKIPCLICLWIVGLLKQYETLFLGWMISTLAISGISTEIALEQEVTPDSLMEIESVGEQN